MKLNQETLIDIFFTTPTVLLATVGATVSTVMGVGFSSLGPLFWLGLVSIGAGVAYGCQRFFTDGESIALKQLERERAKERQKEEGRLQALSMGLQYQTDCGKKARQYLHDLCRLKSAIEEHSKNPMVARLINETSRSSFLELFWKAVDMLEYQSQVYKSSSSMGNKKKLMEVCQQTVDNVGEIVVSLTGVFEGLTTLALTQDAGKCDKITEELEAKLNTELRVAQEMGGGYSSTFGESRRSYIKE